MEPGNPTRNDAPERQGRLALIEVLERDGRVGHSVSVAAWPLTLGRALANDVVLDDPHIAPHHATLQADDEARLWLQVGDTVNGVFAAGQHHRAGARVALPPGGTAMQLGNLQLRLRLPAETLAAEKPLPVLSRARLTGPLLAGLLFLLLGLFDHWVSLDPKADTAAWLPMAVGLPLVVAGWCGLWALVAKIFQHRFDFMGHLRIALPWLLAVELVDLFLTPLAASLGWPWLWRLVTPLQVLLGLLMLRAHLTRLLPMSTRAVSAVLATAALVGSAISLTLTQRATDRFSRPAYMSTLPMPGLHLGTAVPSDEMVQDLSPLAARLSARVKKAREEEPGDRDGD
jgi:hypothetical protein